MTTKQRESYANSVIRMRSLAFDLECKIKKQSLLRRVKRLYKTLEVLEFEIMHTQAIDEVD